MLAVQVSLLAILSTVACGGSNNDTPLRSPSLDYPPPAAQTSDGEIVGADRVPPGDKLQQGPRAGSPGVTPAGASGGAEQTGSKGKPRPCAEIGLEDSSGQSRCKKPPPSGKP